MFKAGESYTSLILGILVVVVVGILVVSLGRSVKLQDLLSPKKDTMSQKTQEDGQKTHTVVVGDHLWGISEKMYKSGYNWVDIAKENNLTNPNVLTVGSKLRIPNVKPKESTVTQAPQTQISEKITGSSYTVKEGDFLWDIAVRAYGDGYRWVDIARSNNLDNPDRIYIGNVLKLPR